MDKNIVKGFTSLYTVQGTPNGYVRGALWVSTIVVIGLGVNGVVKKIKSLNAQKTIEQRLSQIEIDLNNLLKSETPSFNDSAYHADAETMYKVLSKWDVGVIVPCFIMSMWGKQLQDILKSYTSNVDVLKLQSAYGVRTVPRPFILGGDISDADLVTTLRQKLSTGEITCINDDLQSRGILKVQF